MQTRLALTFRGWCVLIIGAIAVWGATLIALPDLAYIGCILLAAIAAAAAWQVIGRKAGELSRSVSTELLSVGHESTIEVQFRAQALMPTPVGQCTDTLPDALRGDATATLPSIGSTLNRGVQTLTVRYPVTGVRRGVHRVGPLRVTIADPFGLLRRHTSLGDATAITIAPALVPLAALPVSAGESGGSLHSSTSHLGEGADNLIARPYAPGDSMRRIHWRATAHRDQLMVRQEEKESTPRAIVILDRAIMRWQPQAGQSDAKDPAFETTLSLCVSVAARLMYEGYLVYICDQDGIELCDPLADDVDIPGMLSAFATLTTRGSDRWDQLRTLAPEGGAGPVVLLTRGVSPHEAAAIAPLAHASTFAVLFAADSDPHALDECHHAGWRTSTVAAAAIDRRDDAVLTAWLTALEQGASRVDS
ncbi:DUF58 domain-containing protein [Microbacterium sp. NC79]|uniref:DUF58 domain-containing protein n=1 Tax=Microbacterium sp. NC79 TaxID=2851009 RepID=UPI001C2C8D0F|nr:DUF58 domain-containing protein [Microbacterium sp. NC79]MBV0895549.1 DUF58 domain-containing protein [Microbacterium sp. NC79]